MKKLIVALTGVLIIVCSCEKDKDKLPLANVHGSWIGTWSTDDNFMYGTFLAPANQEDDEIRGEIFVNINSPSMVGYSPEYSGKADAEEVRVSMKIEGLEIRATANLESDVETSGTFQVGDDITGTFSGSKHSLTVSGTEEIYSIDETDTWYNNFFIVNNNFWVSNLETNKFEVIDKSGNFVENRDNLFIETRPAFFDGTNFWVYGLDYENLNNNVYKISENGDVLDSISLEAKEINNICYHENTLYYSVFSNNTIYAVNSQGELTDSTKFEYIYLNKFIVYKEGFLLQSYSPYLIYIDKQGTLLEIYQVNNTIYSIAQDATGGIYCFTDELIYGNDGVSDTYRIVKVET